MPEQVEAWWGRRQWSKGTAVPYPVGRFRADWERYPVLVRQYHPDLNGGIVLTQVPPVADVWLLWQCDAGHWFVATPHEQRSRPGQSRRRSTWCPDCTIEAGARPARKTRAKPLCVASRAESLAIGDAFASECAPKPASAAEADLRQRLYDRFEFDPSPNAVRVGRAFFTHLEVWPDFVLPELRVAIEYDTIGRDGLEHVGTREAVDKRKDRLLRHANWEVVRVRVGKLQPLGPWDVAASGISGALVDRLAERLREVRGDLIVNSYLR